MSIEEVLQAVRSRSITPGEALQLMRRVRAQEAATVASTPRARQDALSRGDVREFLISSFAKALYMERGDVKCDQPFVDSGLDSIIGVEWVREINQRLQLEIPATTLYDHPTIDQLAAHLREIGGVIAGQSELPPRSAALSLPEGAAHSNRLGLVISKVHKLEEMTLTEWHSAPPAANEITVEVKASGVNFPDVMCVNGLYPTMPEYPFVPGFEVAGVVVATGAAVTRFQVGDAIVGLAGAQLGAHAHFVNVPECNAVIKPANASFAESCSLPVAFSIVHHAFERGDLRAGEQVLIQTATGGCGLVAIQLARLKGARCIGTSSREHKLQILRDLHVEHALNYKTAFDKTIQELTDGRGVDVVLNMLSGEAIQRGLNCLAPSGRYLEIAVHALKTSPKLSLSHLLENQSFHSMDLRSLQLGTGRGGEEYLGTMAEWLEQGKIAPIVSKIYPFARITEALEFVGKALHIGKVVLSHEHDEVVDLTASCIARMQEQERNAAAMLARSSSRLAAQKSDRRAPSAPVERQAGSEAIAVIGMAGQFPRSPTLDEFWENIAAGKNCVTEIAGGRWSVDEFYSTDPLAPGKTNCKWSGQLENADKFDPLFFSISPGEALVMDPQQRLILQSCWECMEQGGIDPALLSGTCCGVFVGVAPGDYGYAGDESGLNSNALMGQSQSILAARVSFFLNLKGPCITLDTACSSALVAITEACNHLRLGTCKAAFAGGVNVMAGPSLHIMTSKAGMLSADGRCFAFDGRANGFVPAEGVGVVLLKRLEDAERDGDAIHAVIRGWGVNQDGKTNGITAPSASSQAQLETEVYGKFDIDPATITLVEAHGTGTRLGDPIEVRALCDAFRRHTDAQHFCALGSVKSNMGHAMAAAGVAGFMKVVLALRNRQLPPTINFEQLNEHIQIDGSPFYISKELKPWVVAAGQRRRAAVSSFGFSGTNAHVVVEEGPDPGEHAAGASTARVPFYPVALSARNAEQLRSQVDRLLQFLDRKDDVQLADLSYTLLCGRKHFKHRLATVAASSDELKSLLETWRAEGKAAGVHVFIRDGDRKESALVENGAQQKFVEQSLGECARFVRAFRPESTPDEELRGFRDKLEIIAANFAQGAALDFSMLFERRCHRPLSLPTYPFATESFWEGTRGSPARDGGALSAPSTAVLHPLLHRNTSDLQGQRFTTTLQTKDFFLADHVVDGNHVLPGVCYLEMARVAVERSSGARPAATGVTLRNFVWLRPVVVESARDLHLGLTATDSGDIDLVAYTSAGEGAEDDTVVHAQGRAAIETLTEPPRVDLASLRAQCRQSIDAAQCYALFEAAGLKYGPTHRGLTRVSAGADAQGRPIVLAEVHLPGAVSGTANEFVLHPSVLDSALQAAIGMTPGGADASHQPARPSLPFALDKLQVFRATPAHAIVVLRESAGAEQISADIQKLDVDICDAEGRVSVRILGFTSRVLKAEHDSVAAALGDENPESRETLFFAPSWRPSPAAEHAGVPNIGERHVLVEPSFAGLLPQLAEHLPDVKWSALSGEELIGADVADSTRDAGVQLFTRVRKILLDKPQAPVSLQVLIAASEESAIVASALNALLRTANQENPKFLGQVIELPHDTTVVGLRAAVEENIPARVAGEDRIRYAGVRDVATVRELPGPAMDAEGAASLPWKDGGVYLITGGAGGLGLTVAREIARRTCGARIVLAGRSVLSAAKLAQLEITDRAGATQQIMYRALDVRDAARVGDTVNSLVGEYGGINGVIHCAGVTRDNFIYKKPVEDFVAVVDPKIAGTQNLARALAQVEHDFLILFSSTAGVFGNVGQCDYALANGFMDGFAANRASPGQPANTRRVLSINWPLWAEGGMQVDAAVLEQMRRQGIDVLDTQRGIDALYRAWSSGESQVIVLSGVRRKLQEALGLTGTAQPAAEPAAVAAAPAGAVDTTLLLEKVQRALIQQISQQLKVKEEDVDVHCELSEFGFDSISLTAFGNALNQKFGIELSPTIFFEHPTVHRFARHLTTEHSALLAQKLGVQQAVVPAPRVAAHARDVAATSPPAARLRRRETRIAAAAPAPAASTPAVSAHPDPVAIVGMSGCFPGARDLDAFWENLRAGNHSISEIPKLRWDWQELYGDPVHESGKTNIKWGGFIDGVDEFDPLFFNMSPLEAISLDPQQRLLMTYTWRAIEDAGYSPQSLSGTRTAIFVGTGSSGYREEAARADASLEGYNSTSGVPSMGPNRMSYLLNLHGPSEPVETACSSSLVAIHRSVRAMQSGDCEQAIAGGINTIVTPWVHIAFGKAGMLCADGRCKTFSKNANGYVRGEGAGMLFLKKLSAAERDGDHIYGLIRASSENHGGRANSLTAPNPRAQAELIKAAYHEADIDPRTISYIETHGTGTPLGDPIEINGLKSAFSELYAERDATTVTEAHCGLGSVKTNIGHLELAAGVAGVIKVLLQLKHKTLAKTLHCEEINPYVELAGSPFYLVRETQPWVALKGRDGQELPRRAGVSSFGFGGVNAHVLIEEYRGERSAEDTDASAASPALIVLSAKTAVGLQEQARQLLAHVTARGCTEADLPHIAYTLQVGRDAMDFRLGFAVSTIADLNSRLSEFLAAQDDSAIQADCYRGEVRKSKDAMATFSTDEDTVGLLKVWLEKRKYNKLLELWVKGYPIDWQMLHEQGGGARPRRLSLPTYPFAREKYWFARSEQIAAARMPEPQARSAGATQWLKVAERWVPEPLFPRDQVWSAIARKKNAQQVLVLYRDEQDAAGIRAALEQVRRDGAGELRIHLRRLPSLADGDATTPMMAHLREQPVPDVVFWMSGPIDQASDFTRAEMSCILQTSQQLMANAGDKGVQVFYCYPRSESGVAQYQEGLSGLFRAIAMECPTHCYRSIEYPLSPAARDYSCLTREWLHRPTADVAPAQMSMVRYRDGERQLSVLVEVQDPKAGEVSSALRRGATYLMVGALGEVGQSVCCELAGRYGSRLVILSRRPLDGGIQKSLDMIKRAGSEVLYRSVDITDERALAATVAGVRRDIGAIHGVFHLARSVADASLLNKDPVTFKRTIAAKVDGTLTIDRVTASDPLEFFVVFSSMAAFGIAGSADYGYATAFQNAFIRERNCKVAAGERQGRGLALCWGQWIVDAHSSAQRNSVLTELGFEFIDAVSAFPVMEAALSTSHRGPSASHDPADAVLGAMAVRDARQVRALYGIGAPVSASQAASNVVYLAGHTKQSADESLTAEELWTLHRELDGDEVAIKSALQGRSYDQLSKLYESLTAS